MLLTFSGTVSLELTPPLPTSWSMVSMQSTEPTGNPQNCLKTALKPLQVHNNKMGTLFSLCSQQSEVRKASSLILQLYHQIDPSFAFISAEFPLEHCCFGSGGGKNASSLYCPDFFFLLFTLLSFQLSPIALFMLTSGQKDSSCMSVEHCSIVGLWLFVDTYTLSSSNTDVKYSCVHFFTVSLT